MLRAQTSVSAGNHRFDPESVTLLPWLVSAAWKRRSPLSKTFGNSLRKVAWRRYAKL
jgi:hypothetical protein